MQIYKITCKSMHNIPPHKKSRDSHVIKTWGGMLDLDCNISPQPERTWYKFLVREERESGPADFFEQACQQVSLYGNVPSRLLFPYHNLFIIAAVRTAFLRIPHYISKPVGPFFFFFLSKKLNLVDVFRLYTHDLWFNLPLL